MLFHVAGTWNLPLIDRDEPRFAEASREMIERGDYVVPYFNNQFRFDKPPLTYWAQVVSYKIFGENDFAARFPSAIAAALIALSLLAWGSRLRPARASQARIGGERVGWWAAIIFTLSLQTFIHAKAAVADMWLVLFMALAYWAGYELLGLPEKRTGGGSDSTIQREPHWWWVFYMSLAIGFLAKGPIAWTPLLTVAAMKFVVVDLAKRFKFVRGLLLMLAIVALWSIPALIRTHGEFFTVGIGRHVIGRSFGAMEGHGANSFGLYLLLLPFYFVTIFLTFLPWSIKLPGLARKLWPGRDGFDNYLIAGAAIIFIIFSLVKTKLPHYTLPAFPLLALLLARHWSKENSSLFKPMAIATTCVWLAIALILPAIVSRSFPAYALFQKSRDYLRPEMEFGAIDYAEPSLVWYFRSRAKGFLTPLKKKDVTDFMAKSGPRFVIMPSATVEPLFPNHPANWKTFSMNGFNIAKWKHVDLTLVLKPE